MSTNALEIENLSFAYDSRRQIIGNLSLTVPQGKVIAIMGGSGSGKTTILRNICGQVTPTNGNITVLGRRLPTSNWRQLQELRREVGVLFQFGGLFTDLSVYDNVAFPLCEHWDLSPATIHDIVMFKLESVGLRGLSNLFPSELSGGMQRRVALARAVSMDPKLILYDEPFTGLDPISLAITAKLVKNLNVALGATSVIVTHDVAETFQIVDYVYLMWQGEIVAQGTPAEMRDSSSPRVRQFVDAKTDGPLPFHQPAPPLSEDIGLGK
ncbi:MAG: ABC transporter ATP-binding protein [Gammaproteobacteria bacterium WSBS_2016_MAG_OTU1]